uniref:Elongation factor 1-beta n=1 Tax=Ascaris lumbricoides TaxID=6252 RepID=A0A0M3IQZ2_ASCLU
MNDLLLGSSSVAKPASEEKISANEEKGAGEDFDLFGSSDEEVDEEKERIKQERLKAYAAKKALKPASVAKSSVILDIKPWDDETNMDEMEKFVRAIEKEGLVWGGGKLIPLAYGIKKLQIICVIEDDKVSVDDLIDRITEDGSDYVCVFCFTR